MSKDAKPSETPEELQVVQLLAKALHNVDGREAQPADPEQRKALWQADKRTRIVQARKLVSQLKRMGVTLTPPEPDAEKEKKRPDTADA